jgi:hypothetical protein
LEEKYEKPYIIPLENGNVIIDSYDIEYENDNDEHPIVTHIDKRII